MREFNDFRFFIELSIQYISYTLWINILKLHILVKQTHTILINSSGMHYDPKKHAVGCHMSQNELLFLNWPI